MSEPLFETPTLDVIASALPAYAFEAFIAQGGMGVVYKATQLSLDRRVAIKILPRELCEDPVFRQSFETEARAMARLNHPNLIGIYDFGEAGGLLYLVMEFVNGKSLHHSAHGRQIEPGQAVELAIGICRGLGHAHESGIIHRDVKPANILLTPRAEPKVGDLGLARPAGATAGGLAMGTPGYTAPEVMSDPEHADQRSDLFAVGVILREMLTGTPADSPDPAGPIEDPVLENLVRRATLPDPERRFQHAAEMISALEAWQNPAPGARRQPVPEDARPLKPSPAPVAAPVHANGDHAKSQGAKLAVIVVLIVAIVLIWQTTEKVKAARAEAARAAEINNPKRDSAPKPPPAKPSPGVASPTSPTSRPIPAVPRPADPDIETPAQSLARLQPELAAGRRGEMPLGTLDYGDSRYFFVASGMTPAEARRFAAGYGGNLALPATTADLEWLAETLEERSPTAETWLGASRSELHGWQLDDGSLWNLTPPEGDGEALLLTGTGTVEARAPKTRAGFFIEWRHDGAQPTSLAELLEKTAKSIDAGSAVYPPGTFALGDRRVFAALKETTFSEARSLAGSAGGSLLTLPVESESKELAKSLAARNPAGPWWIGATRDEDGEWRWIDGSPWYYANWTSADAPIPDGAAVILPDGRWSGSEPGDRAAGFLIAWGDPPEPTATGDVDEPSALADLRSAAAELLVGLRKKRTKALIDNADEFAWKLDVWLRKNIKSEVARLTPHVRKLKECVNDDHRIEPPAIGTSIVITPEMKKIIDELLEKQARIDADYVAGVARVRDAYLPRLEQRLAIETSRGQPTLAARIRAERETCADLNAWIDSFCTDEAPAGD